MNTAILIVGVIVVALVALAMVALIVRNLLYICGPNEVLVFSGAHRQVEGRSVGYRIVKGGRSLRIPLLETVDRVDLTNMIIEVSVTNAYSKGGVPLTIQGVANVKIAGHEPVLDNALERFLGYDRKAIMQVAKDTLEGNLRGVLAQLTPEQVNEDKISFAEKLLEEAEHDLTKLGLVLDTLKVQNVSDDKGYLKSIGRKSSADLVMRSSIAEAQAKAQAKVKDAGNRERARLIELDSQIAILRAETERRVMETLSRREALIAEQIGQVKTAVARAEAELKVQEARVEQVRRKLEADVIAPAQAEMEAAEAAARGASAKIVEDGKANVAVLDQMITTWQASGGNARDIFLLQKLPTTLAQLTSTIQGVRVDKVTVLPADTGARARGMVSLSEELRGSLGIDVPALLASATGAAVGSAATRPAAPAAPRAKG
jgi:flotillin